MTSVRRWYWLAPGAVLALLIAQFVFRIPLLAAFQRVLPDTATVADRVTQFGPAARARLLPYFQRAGVAYPPDRFVLAAFKAEGELQLYAAGPGQPLQHIQSYPVLAASGWLGPKLRQGDRQVPEGLYGIDSLNPNSRFHLALRVNYPNADDRARAAEDERSELGGDIMIHGGFASIGCLAMGDETIEELFVLAAEAGRENGRVILSPVDFRVRDLPPDFEPPTSWTPELYERIAREVTRLPARPMPQ